MSCLKDKKMKFKELQWVFLDVSWTLGMGEDLIGPFVEYIYKNYLYNREEANNVGKRISGFFSILDKEVGWVYDVYLKKGMLEVEIERENWKKIRKTNKAPEIRGLKLKDVDDIMPNLYYRFFISYLRR